jgi:hypothetical protein
MAYIGVTGFTKREQVANFLELIPDSPRETMIGVLASYKSLRGIPQNPLRAKRTPSNEELSRIFVPHLNTLNLIHYNSEPGQGGTIAEDMLRLEGLVSEELDGFQLNLCWPNPNEVEKFRKHSQIKHLNGVYAARIVLQIGRRAIEELGGSPDGVAERVKDWYGGIIDTVLFDFSGGLGKDLYMKELGEFLLCAQNHGLEVGVAGGLGPDSMHLLNSTACDVFIKNIDAEGKLRNSQNELDIGKALLYYNQAVEYFYPERAGAKLDRN